MRVWFAAAVIAGLLLLVDPWAGPGCPAGLAHGGDCARYGLFGRLYAAALMRQARSELDAGRPKQALAAVDYALGLRPNSPRAHTDAAMAYERMGAVPEALRSYTRAIEFGPTYLPARMARGSLYLRLGEKRMAWRDIRVVVAAAAEPGQRDRATLQAYVVRVAGQALPID